VHRSSCLVNLHIIKNLEDIHMSILTEKSKNLGARILLKHSVGKGKNIVLRRKNDRKGKWAEHFSQRKNERKERSDSHFEHEDRQLDIYLMKI